MRRRYSALSYVTSFYYSSADPRVLWLRMTRLSSFNLLPSVMHKKEVPWKERSFLTRAYSSFFGPEDLVDPKVSLEFSILKLFAHLRVISRLLLLSVYSVRLPPIGFGILRLNYFVRLCKLISFTNSFSSFCVLAFALSVFMAVFNWPSCAPGY